MQRCGIIQSSFYSLPPLSVRNLQPLDLFIVVGGKCFVVLIPAINYSRLDKMIIYCGEWNQDNGVLIDLLQYHAYHQFKATMNYKLRTMNFPSQKKEAPVETGAVTKTNCL